MMEEKKEERKKSVRSVSFWNRKKEESLVNMMCTNTDERYTCSGAEILIERYFHQRKKETIT